MTNTTSNEAEKLVGQTVQQSAFWSLTGKARSGRVLTVRGSAVRVQWDDGSPVTAVSLKTLDLAVRA